MKEFDELYDRLKISETKLYEQKRANRHLIVELDLANCRAERAERMVERLIEAGNEVANYRHEHWWGWEMDITNTIGVWRALVAEWRSEK